MTEQEYTKLVMYHLEKQKEAEDEAYLLNKEIERLQQETENRDGVIDRRDDEIQRLRQQVEFNRKYGIHSEAMKEIERLQKAYAITNQSWKELQQGNERLRKRVKWLEDRECPQCGFEFDATEENE